MTGAIPENLLESELLVMEQDSLGQIQIVLGPFRWLTGVIILDELGECQRPCR